jgi:hypothetical protein
VRMTANLAGGYDDHAAEYAIRVFTRASSTV